MTGLQPFLSDTHMVIQPSCCISLCPEKGWKNSTGSLHGFEGTTTGNTYRGQQRSSSIQISRNVTFWLHRKVQSSFYSFPIHQLECFQGKLLNRRSTVRKTMSATSHHNLPCPESCGKLNLHFLQTCSSLNTNDTIIL